MLWNLSIKKKCWVSKFWIFIMFRKNKKEKMLDLMEEDIVGQTMYLILPISMLEEVRINLVKIIPRHLILRHSIMAKKWMKISLTKYILEITKISKPKITRICKRKSKIPPSKEWTPLLLHQMVEVLESSIKTKQTFISWETPWAQVATGSINTKKRQTSLEASLNSIASFLKKEVV